MRVVSMKLPDKLIEEIDRLVEEDGVYPSRSEFIRHAIMAFLDDYYKKKKVKIELKKSKKEAI